PRSGRRQEHDKWQQGPWEQALRTKATREGRRRDRAECEARAEHPDDEAESNEDRVEVRLAREEARSGSRAERDRRREPESAEQDGRGDDGGGPTEPPVRRRP